jgi:hypothetical protein
MGRKTVNTVSQSLIVLIQFTLLTSLGPKMITFSCAFCTLLIMKQFEYHFKIFFPFSTKCSFPICRFSLLGRSSFFKTFSKFKKSSSFCRRIIAKGQRSEVKGHWKYIWHQRGSQLKQKRKEDIRKQHG